jgi:Rrf2 family protein
MVSNTADYALRAVLLLARDGQKRAVPADEIAAHTGAPRSYMAKVLNAVAKSGLIKGTRGPAGGFVLAVPASEITLGRIIDLFDTTRKNLRCMLGNGACDRTHPCPAHHTWQAVSAARRLPLLTTTIADLLEGRVVASTTTTLTTQESRNVA